MVYLQKPRMSTVEAEDIVSVGLPSVLQHETVVTKVNNDMLMAAVSGQVSALCSTVPEMIYNVFSWTLNPTHFTSLHLCLFDLSAAFDTTTC